MDGCQQTVNSEQLHSLDPDFISLNETHLSSDSLELDGFTWFGHNSTAHRRAVKASGGVGIFVKNTVFDHFFVNIMDKTYDGILCLHLNIEGHNILLS